MGRVLWVTTDEPVESGQQFGHGARVYNVIDTRQSYLQDVVVAGLRGLGYSEQADRSVHFNYEMVALSPRCCAELGIPLSEEDRKRPYVEVSGRKGLGREGRRPHRQPHREGAARKWSRATPRTPRKRTAPSPRRSRSAALRYFLLKFTRNTVIAFDLQEALSFEGETGPYVQYSAVRARNILRKYEERGEKIPDFAAELTTEALARQLAVRGFLADAAGRVEGRRCGRPAPSTPANRRT